MSLFDRFERLVDPFPVAESGPPPTRFWPFLWQATQGVRRYIAGMTLFTAIIGVFEAWLFSLLGKLVDWLAGIPPAELWAREGRTLLALGAVLACSTLAVALQTMFKHQTLAGNFPMRLRWSFHRLMLGQSMAFFQDEFAGRIATKVMQTALAVRDVWFTVCDILVFIIIYFVTLMAVVGGFEIGRAHV